MPVTKKPPEIPWEEIRIESWEHFDELVDDLPSRKWVFRGHSDMTQELETSIGRLFDDFMKIKTSKSGKKLKFVRDKREKLMIESFISCAHLYLRRLPDEKESLEWLAIMQHHGAPTRLLDVTFSPNIASYFALEKGSGDCCVFGFNHKALSKIDFETLDIKEYKTEVFANHRGENSFIMPYEPKMKNERILAQQGLFLVPSNVEDSFQDILDIYGIHGKACKRYVIPEALRYKGLVRLKKMNITSTSLFPGLDGFCRSIGFEVIEPLHRLGRVY